MKSTKKVLAAMCALTFCMSAVACGDDASSGASTTTTTGTTAPPKELNSEAKEQVKNAADLLKDRNLENKTIKFFSHWPINPSDGAVVGADIQMFRDKYQGVIEDINVGWPDRYQELGKLVASGQSPDFFSAMDMDGFPKGAVLEMFQPIDDYIDVNGDLWKSAKEVNDKFQYKNKHYVAAIGAEPDVICIYNTKNIKNAGLDDPYELYKKDEWTFSKFAEMCKAFTNQDEEKVGVDGWWYEKGLLHQCGLPIISLDASGKATCNVKNPMMLKQADHMKELGDSKVMFPNGVRGGENNENGQRGLGEGKTLFWPCGMWGIEGTAESKADMGDIAAGELAMAPMPRMDESDTYYCTSRVNGFFLVKGAPNPECWAAFMDCRMVSKDKLDSVYEDTLREYGWSDLMIEQRRAVFKVCQEHPIFEFSGSISAELSTYWDDGEHGCNFERWTMNRWGDPTSLGTMIEEHFNEVQALLDEFNAKVG